MFKSIQKLLDEGRSHVSIIVTATGDKLMATIVPKAKDGQPPELSQPLQVIEDAENIGPAVTSALERYSNLLVEAGSNLDEIEKSVKKTVASKSKGTTPAKKKDEADSEKDEIEGDASTKSLISGTVAACKAAIDKCGDAALLKLALEEEGNGRNRNTLMKMIEDRIAQIQVADKIDPKPSDDPVIQKAREIISGSVAATIKAITACDCVETLQAVIAEEEGSGPSSRITVIQASKARISVLASKTTVVAAEPEPPVEETEDADSLDLDLGDLDI